VSDSERQLGVIKDILLPLDIETRYDLYFTDKRIAIVCMGHSSRAEHGASGHPSVLFGIAPEALPNTDDEKIDKQAIEEEINGLTLDKKLKLSKKSCFYTYEEIEEVKLILEKKPKFMILSADCVSKFSPNAEQFKLLADLLPTVEMLKNKTMIFGNLNFKALQKESNAFLCKNCGSKNDADAIFCERCGVKIRVETDNPKELTCGSCGAKNNLQALFCKKCGTPIRT
jgi:ribosomal protein L40E